MLNRIVKRIDTVFLPVTDLERSIAWYTAHLGLTLRWKVEGYAALNVGETPLTLVQVAEVKPYLHQPFNFYAPDIKAAHCRLQEAGVQVGDLRDHGDLLEFEFRDPDGNTLGLVWFQEK